MTSLYKNLSPVAAALPVLPELLAAIENERKINLSGLPSSLDALVFAHIFSKDDHALLLVFEEARQAERMFDDLAKLVGEERLVLFSQAAQQSVVREALHKNTAAAETFGQILEAIEKLTLAKENVIIIADAESLIIPLPTRSQFAKETLVISAGEVLGYDFFSLWLKEHRFEEKQFVETSGDYAIRGGIVDIFPFTDTVPYRIEFFGDMVESIREFDSISQRSIAERQNLSLVPNALEAEYMQRTATIFDYLPDKTLISEFEPELIRKKLEEAGGEKILDSLQSKTSLFITNFPDEHFPVIDFGAKRQPSFNANLKVIRNEIHALVGKGDEVIILSETKDLMKRMEDLLESGETESDVQIDESNIPELSEETTSVSSGKIIYRTPSLAHGFLLPDAMHLCVFAEHELFGRRRERGAASRKRASRTKGISLCELRTLKRGDLLVHEDKGIGKFMGLDTIDIRGAKQEVVRLNYRDNDILFVNLDYIAKLSRYSAADVKACAQEAHQEDSENAEAAAHHGDDPCPVHHTSLR